MKAVLCPVCNGTGKYNPGYLENTCHGCGGKGWVEVKDEPAYYPYYPYYVPIPPCSWPGTITFTKEGE